MSELYIVNYCHKNCEPLKNIMRLPKEEAFALANKLAEQNKETTAFYRFADFDNYYWERLETDSLLYKELMRQGGMAKYEHPLSFVLQGSEYLYEWFGEGIITKVPLDLIPDEQISFTYGDSMSVRKRDGGFTLITKGILMELLEGYKGTAEDFVKEMNEKYGYVEVQVWGDVRTDLYDYEIL